MAQKEQEAEPLRQLSWADFLLSSPPGEVKEVVGAVGRTGGVAINSWWVIAPELTLFCGSEDCRGLRRFASDTALPQLSGMRDWIEFWISYRCRNCGRSEKVYALRMLGIPRQDTTPRMTKVVKVGELPPFGMPRVHPRLIRVFGSEWEFFKKGRRSENEGLGIGAFAYYRRVITDKWEQLLGQIIQAAEAAGAPPDKLAALNAAKAEKRFSAAVSAVKDENAIPTELLIDGTHNPLTLLHDATSERLHSASDEECLRIAGDIRNVLSDLAERIDRAMKNRASLRASVRRLSGGTDEGGSEPGQPGG